MSCVPNVVSFSGLSIIDCPFLERLFKMTNPNIQQQQQQQSDKNN
jgi:hypothetical protein